MTDGVMGSDNLDLIPFGFVISIVSCIVNMVAFKMLELGPWQPACTHQMMKDFCSWEAVVSCCEELEA